MCRCVHLVEHLGETLLCAVHNSSICSTVHIAHVQMALHKFCASCSPTYECICLHVTIHPFDNKGARSTPRLSKTNALSRAEHMQTYEGRRDVTVHILPRSYHTCAKLFTGASAQSRSAGQPETCMHPLHSTCEVLVSQGLVWHCHQGDLHGQSAQSTWQEMFMLFATDSMWAVHAPGVCITLWLGTHAAYPLHNLKGIE